MTDCIQSYDPHMKQAVIQFEIKVVIKVLQIIGIQPVSTSGCRITEVSVAWDHVAKVRLLLLRPNVRQSEFDSRPFTKKQGGNPGSVFRS